MEWLGFPYILPWSADLFRSIFDLLRRLGLYSQYVATADIQNVTRFLDLLVLTLRIFCFDFEDLGNFLYRQF